MPLSFRYVRSCALIRNPPRSSAASAVCLSSLTYTQNARGDCGAHPIVDKSFHGFFLRAVCDKMSVSFR